MGWIDSVCLVIKVVDVFYYDVYDVNLGGCLDRLWDINFGFFEFVV